MYKLAEKNEICTIIVGWVCVFTDREGTTSHTDPTGPTEMSAIADTTEVGMSLISPVSVN